MLKTPSIYGIIFCFKPIHLPVPIIVLIFYTSYSAKQQNLFFSLNIFNFSLQILKAYRCQNNDNQIKQVWLK